MTQKENAQLHNAELSTSKNKANSTSTKPMTPRQERVTHALMQAEEWVSREAVDRISGASNGPAVIQQLRQRLGYDAIEMGRINAIDCDGLPTQPGRYRLTDIGRKAIQALQERA